LPSSNSCHRCARPGRPSGRYGILHPMPYYIPNPTIAAERNDCRRSARSHQDWRFPNNPVPLTLGGW
jgi:hypothetical protein